MQTTYSPIFFALLLRRHHHHPPYQSTSLALLRNHQIDDAYEDVDYDDDHDDRDDDGLLLTMEMQTEILLHETLPNILLLLSL